MKKFVISTHGFDMGIGGLKVLHKLCHLLNTNGYDAYLIPQNFAYPFSMYEGYQTKMITQEVYENLDEAIVVYPESWFGNYLNAKNVVRWILGFPGEDHVVTWNENDLWFWYLPFFIPEKYNQKNPNNLLYVDEQHREIFFDHKQLRSGSCWTLRKAQDYITPKDYVHPQDSTFIPYHAAGDLINLSRLFNSKELFYCYDNYTYLAVQSLMCNTDTVVIPNDKSKEEFFNGYELNKYIAYGIDDLDRARGIRHEFFDHLDSIERRTVGQLHTFVEKCYDYFK
jgi:hypothetical protein